VDNISISLSEAGPDREISEVRVDGVIDTLTAGEFEEVLDTLVRRGRYRVIVDLAGVDYISSAGWGIFISHIRNIRDNKGDIKLANMIPNVYEIYELLEFDNVLKSYGSLDDARIDFDHSVPGPSLMVASEATEVIVMEPPEKSSSPAHTTTSSSTFNADADIETMVLALIKEDPFFTISELAREVTRRSKFEAVGWWGVFGVLRRNGMLKKRARFRYSQGRR
jgi:anti-sigma B factor antagonist